MVSLESSEVRTAEMSDAAAIAELSCELGYPTSVGQAERRLQAVLGSHDHTVLVACDARRVVGWIHVFLALRVESDAFAELGGFVVAATHRRRGIGRRLLATAEAWVMEHDIGKLRVRSRTTRDDARAFYENLGFAVQKEQRVFDRLLTATVTGTVDHGNPPDSCP